MRSHRPPSRVAVFAFAFVLGAAFAVGVTAFAAPATARKPDTLYPRLEVFAKVLAYVENNYVEEVDESRLVYSAIKGMLSSLDPHTVFMEPREYQSLRDDTSGEFGGLGLELAQRDDQVVVLAPIDETPAARAGVRAGDVIDAIDGAPVKGLTVPEVALRLKGPPGTQVTLRLWRPDFSQPRDFPLVRDHIRVQSVDGRLLEGGLGYARIKSFQDGTDEALKKLLARLRQEAGAGFKGLVLDLRNNPGGLLEQGVKVADRFLRKGVIVTTRGRGGRHPEEEVAHEPDTEPGYPVVVLVNGGTASASEVVAGALQDQKRATLLGTTSFGKGSVQLVIELDDGSGLKLTTARYYTPNGRSIQEHGIQPDVVVRAGDVELVPREVQLAGHLVNDAPAQASPGVDVARVLPAFSPAAGADVPLAAATAALAGWDRFQAALASQRTRGK